LLPSPFPTRHIGRDFVSILNVLGAIKCARRERASFPSSPLPRHGRAIRALYCVADLATEATIAIDMPHYSFSARDLYDGHLLPSRPMPSRSRYTPQSSAPAMKAATSVFVRQIK
jgi:hypothetical protein